MLRSFHVRVGRPYVSGVPVFAAEDVVSMVRGWQEEYAEHRKVLEGQLDAGVYSLSESETQSLRGELLVTNGGRDALQRLGDELQRFASEVPEQLTEKESGPL